MIWVIHDRRSNTICLCITRSSFCSSFPANQSENERPAHEPFHTSSIATLRCACAGVGGLDYLRENHLTFDVDPGGVHEDGIEEDRQESQR
jgi:hypothetical protein